MSEMAEPTTPEAIADWIASHLAARDEFASVADATEAHRLEHGCDTFAGGDGPLLQVLAGVRRPSSVLEIGTGLGYSTLHLATGAGSGAVVDTIESDAGHAELARANLARQGLSGRVTVHVGRDGEVLPRLEPAYGLIVYDADIPSLPLLEQFDRLLAGDGTLITSNLFLGRYIPDDPRLAEGAAYREALFAGPWSTAFVGGKAVSVRRPDDR